MQNPKSFWLNNQFVEEISVLEMPKSKPVISEEQTGIESEVMRFTSAFSKQFVDFSVEKNQSAANLLFTTLSALLYRYTKQRNFVICTHSMLSNGEAKDKPLVFPIQNHIGEKETYLTLAQKLDVAVAEMAANKDLPPLEWEEEDQLSKDDKITISIINEVLFSFADEANPISDKMELLAKPFGLTFSVTQTGLNLVLTLFYKKELYSKEVIERMLQHFENLLELMVQMPNTPLEEIRYLSYEEEKELLVGLNQTSVPFPSDQSIVDLFQEQVVANPDAVALVVDEKEMTYRELDECSNQMARFLINENKVTEGNLVGVKLERSEWLLLSLIAVMKTGAAYVPIDPSYPENRIAYIENDSQCHLTIDENWINNFESNRDKVSNENVDLTFSSENLAYVIYTSGSTGNPKGVMINHRSAVAMIAWAKEEFDLAGFDIVYAVTSHCFDLSVYEFFYTLAVGKKIRLIKSALNIPEYLDKDEKILINTVPSVVKQLLDSEVNLEQVSMLNMAGEPIPVDTVRKLDLEAIEVRNLYGPSEDTTYSSYYRIKTSDFTSVPIGKPIANTRFYILDDQLQLLPKGNLGELYIGGEGLAQGYLGREDLTAEKFVPNPFIPGTLMYSTGDLAKYMADGNLEFYGRKDKQIKLRGFRIELGEIEDQLLQQKDFVKEAVVEIKEVKNEKSIVAYVVPNGKLNKVQILTNLKEFLPKPMLPSYFVELEEIPLTPNGKKDRNALPDVDLSTLGSKNYVAPRNEIEAELVELWEKVLRVEKIGIEDSFFERGGNSLMAIKMINKINKKFGLNMTVEFFFDSETIANMSGLLKLQMNSENSEAEVGDGEEITI